MQLSANLPALMRHAGRAVIDAVMPPRYLACGLACGETVGGPDAVCGRCWSLITFFAPPYCSICGLTAYTDDR